ncbi:MAG: hypothetical protein RLZZ271_1527 [Pseudomonadota bacterium]|jgi:SAM-dependent methyltransferase
MNDWTSGYRADINYTYGYYDILNPLRAKLSMLKAGLACPNFETACELGFGYGLSINMHAAASSTQWWGTDFNPVQAAFAQKLAATSGSGARLFDQSFAEFVNRPDLPEFDFIGLHGVWTWISGENRSHILDFIRRKLRPGGVVMASYNTLPGWSAHIPLRELMMRHVRTTGSPSVGIEQQIKNALDFADKLLATEPAYLAAYPGMAKALADLRKMNLNYVAHEYFNRDWMPMHFGEIADFMATAKLEFACSARHLEQIPGLRLKPQQLALVDGLSDKVMKESTRDLLCNSGFRTDLWVKGAQRLSPQQLAQDASGLMLALARPAKTIPLEFKLPTGKVSLRPEVYQPIMALLGEHGPKSIGQIMSSSEGKGLSVASILDAATVLCGAGFAHVVQELPANSPVFESSKKLNADILARFSASEEINHMASPLTGGAINADRMTLLFMQASLAGKTNPKEMAKFAWAELSKRGHSVIANGKRMETAKDNLEQLNTIAQHMQTETLPILRMLKVF